MNSSSFSTNDSKTCGNSALNLKKSKKWSNLLFSIKNFINIDFQLSENHLSVSSSVMMTLSRSLGSALFSHQNLWVFFLCSGLKPSTFKTGQPVIFQMHTVSCNLLITNKIKKIKSSSFDQTYVAMCSNKPPYSTVMLPSVTFLSTSSPQQ